MFCLMDTFHLLIEVYLSIVFCVNHIRIGSFELSWICFVFCHMDGCFEYFSRNNRTCIELKDV